MEYSNHPIFLSLGNGIQCENVRIRSMKIISFTFLIVLLLSSCDINTSEELINLKSKVSLLESDYKILSEKYDELVGRIDSLEGLINKRKSKSSKLNNSNVTKNNILPINHSNPSHPKIESKPTTSNNTRNNTYNNNKSSYSTTRSSSYSGRCQATTKKGTQCKRTAQSGSRYCWQHQR